MKTKFQQKALFFALFLLCMSWVCVPAFAATDDNQAVAAEVGPGVEPAAQEPAAEDISTDTIVQGESLGTFSTTAYCPCRKCSGKSSITHAGTVPVANHTISADLSIFPLGTKLMINGIVYTVEDSGSGVRGNKLDIFFNSHQEALNYGRRTVEVFAVK